MKILITGGNDGIGLETAKLLATKGHTLTLVAKDPAKLETALKSLSGSGHKTISADLSLKAEVDGLKQDIDAQKYDAFINNAGVGKYGIFTEMPIHDQVVMMDINMKALTVLSYFYLSQAKKGDSLINISSFLGSTSSGGAAVYAATKGYVTILSESLWAEYKSKGIYVCCFCPGVTYTNFHNLSGVDKNKMPKAITQTPAEVAQEIVAALEKRNNPRVVSGFINRLMLFATRFITTKALVKAMAGSIKK
jgi:short-subunit dehydrogenase